jgi:sulfatase modifying factor 1
VGTKLANELGVSDMSGNVWEWCENWWQGYESYRVGRGGSWDNDAISCRVVSNGFNFPSGTGLNSFGFRVARSSVP